MTLWFISDTHFGHANMLTFLNEDGSQVRPFASVDEVDSLMMDQWAKYVKPSDHIYHLGDVAMRREYLKKVKTLPGHKRLILGNHDIYDHKTYVGEAGFEKLYGSRVFDKMIFTHLPIHPESMGRFTANVHGHTHARSYPLPYVNICVEVTNYRPLALEEVKQRANAL